MGLAVGTSLASGVAGLKWTIWPPNDDASALTRSALRRTSRRENAEVVNQRCCRR